MFDVIKIKMPFNVSVITSNILNFFFFFFVTTHEFYFVNKLDIFIHLILARPLHHFIKLYPDTENEKSFINSRNKHV